MTSKLASRLVNQSKHTLNLHLLSKISVARCSPGEHLQRDQPGAGGRGGQPQPQLGGGGQPCGDLGDVAQGGHGGGGQVILASYWSMLLLLASDWS